MSRQESGARTLGTMANARGRRVLVVEPSGNLWGSERALLDLATGLTDTGWRLGLCCPPNTAMLQLAHSKFDEVFPYFIAHLHRKTKWNRAIALLQLVRAIRTFKPDLIYVNQAGVTKLALTAARITRHPLVTHTRLREDVDYLLPMLTQSRVRHAVCVSDFIRGCFEPKAGADKLKLITALYDCYEMANTQPKVQAENQNRVICIGRIESNKGQDVLVAALGQLGDKIPGLHLRLLGAINEDSFSMQLRAEVQRLNLSERVEFVGFSSDIWPHFTASDFLVCPSHVEALGRVIFEAWDAGIVPIAYAGSGGPAETIAASNAGILYDHQDPSCLADAIFAAYEMPARVRSEMVERGRSWMKENLDPTACAMMIANVFDAAIDQTK
jgi:hypothetical protein